VSLRCDNRQKFCFTLWRGIDRIRGYNNIKLCPTSRGKNFETLFLEKIFNTFTSCQSQHRKSSKVFRGGTSPKFRVNNSRRGYRGLGWPSGACSRGMKASRWGWNRGRRWGRGGERGCPILRARFLPSASCTAAVTLYLLSSALTLRENKLECLSLSCFNAGLTVALIK